MTTTASADADYAQAVDELAIRVVRAVEGVHHPNDLLVRYVERHSNSVAALAAVRILSADALAAHLLTGVSLSVGEVELLAESLRLFPPAAIGPEPTTAVVTTWRYWALGDVARQLGANLGDMPAPLDSPLGCPEDWLTWSPRLMQLSVLALPGLRSRVHDAVQRDPLAVERAATRAVLRRDYPTAAALGRWLALLSSPLLNSQGARLGLDPVLLSEQVGLLGGGAPRTELDVGIARYLLRGSGL